MLGARHFSLCICKLHGRQSGLDGSHLFNDLPMPLVVGGANYCPVDSIMRLRETRPQVVTPTVQVGSYISHRQSITRESTVRKRVTGDIAYAEGKRSLAPVPFPFVISTPS